MSPDTPAASHPFSNRTADYGVAEGLGIVLAAEDELRGTLKFLLDEQGMAVPLP